ncbi:hypothetical protein M9458_049730, partial [Cirrhinus mrigala]
GQTELTELPFDSKLDAEGNESPEDESEEGEDDEGEDDEDDDDDDEEEEEEEEEGEDEDDEDDDDEEDENEDGEEDDEEEEEEEEAAAAQQAKGLAGLPKTMALGTTEKSDVANENISQTRQDMMEDSPLKVRTEASEKMDMNETIPEKMLFGPIPGILDLEDGCLVSAVRVVARFSDEEDSEEANDSPGPPAECEVSLENPVESKNENQSDDDDDWEDDDDEDEQLLMTEKNILQVETSQGTTIKCDPQLPDVPLSQNEGISDLDTGNLEVPSASPKSKAVTTADDDEDDWDDVDEKEEEVQTKKPLNLFLTLLGQKEPESPEVSWESGSDKSDGTPEGEKELNIEMQSGEMDQLQEALVQDHNTSRRVLYMKNLLSTIPGVLYMKNLLSNFPRVLYMKNLLSNFLRVLYMKNLLSNFSRVLYMKNLLSTIPRVLYMKNLLSTFRRVLYMKNLLTTLPRFLYMKNLPSTFPRVLYMKNLGASIGVMTV